MKTFKTGEKVGYGLYISAKALDIRFVGSDGETLEGKRGVEYTRLSGLLVVAAAPVIGGVFAMAFPFIVIGMVFAALFKGVYSLVAGTVKEHAHLATMQWQPTAAYLKKNERDAKENKDGSELGELNKEVQDRKNNE